MNNNGLLPLTARESYVLFRLARLPLRTHQNLPGGYEQWFKELQSEETKSVAKKLVGEEILQSEDGARADRVAIWLLKKSLMKNKLEVLLRRVQN
jgi:hypothetical protein